MELMMNFDKDIFPIVTRSSLSLISKSHSLRCDAKQAENRFVEFDKEINSRDYFTLGEVLPTPFVKGAQPHYLESLEPEGIPVINTLSIQNLCLNAEACRYISEEDYEALSPERKVIPSDVLLTVDGGTSIGKPLYFDLEDSQFTTDSHVVILRPVGIRPLTLVYLLASPIGQLQFQQAESGASGQTSVTEDDIRRFRFPRIQVESLDEAVDSLHRNRVRIADEIESLKKREMVIWGDFSSTLFKKA